MRFLQVFCVVWVVGVLASCSDAASPSAAPTPRVAVAAKVEPAISVAPMLRDRLPADTALYARIPSPWGLIAAPNGRALDVAKLHPQHVAAITAIREAFIAEPLLKDGPAIFTRLALAYWAGPLEIAVSAPTHNIGPDSKMLVSLPLRGLADAAALAALLATGGAPPLQFDADGYSALPNAAAHFSAGTGQLLILLGDGVTLDALKSAEAGLKPAAAAFAASEARIDQSGQGFYVWLDMTAMRSMLSMAAMQAGAGAGFLNSLAADVKSAALGFGTVNGKGRLALEIEAPKAAFLRYLPREAKQFAVNSASAPSYAGSASLLPSPEEFAQFQDAIAADAGAEAAAELASGLAKARDGLGFALTDVMAALGPDLLFFGDTAGDFVAVKVRNRRALDNLLKTLGTLEPVKLSRSGDIQLLDLTPQTAPLQPMLGAAVLFMRMHTRMFWLDEGDYLIFASTPQALRDRQAGKPAFALGDWLAAERGPQSGQSLLMVAGPTHNAARTVYYATLNLLQSLGDVAGASIDPFGFASARELGLPTEGVAGLGVEVSADRLAFVLSYDANGLDLVSSGGSGTSGLVVIAVVGIMAAIALPVYQDYIARSQVSEALAASAAAKTYIAEYYASTGKLPASLDDPGTATDSRYGRLRWSDGVLVVELRDEAPVNSRVRGQTIGMALKKDGSWICGNAGYSADASELTGGNPAEATTLPEKFQPSMCR